MKYKHWSIFAIEKAVKAIEDDRKDLDIRLVALDLLTSVAMDSWYDHPSHYYARGMLKPLLDRMRPALAKLLAEHGRKILAGPLEFWAENGKIVQGMATTSEV